MPSGNAPSLEPVSELEALLSPFRRNGSSPYRKARWLLSDFDDPVWVIESDYRFEIDWRIQLPGDGCLTSREHYALWEALRSWPIARTHSRSTGRPFTATSTERRNLQATLHCIDYLLLRAERLNLAESGLEGLTVNAICAMTGSILSDRRVTTSVYEWPERLSAFLRARVAEAKPDHLQQVIDANPIVSYPLPARERRITSLDDDEVIAARAWLYDSQYYRRTMRFDYAMPIRPFTALLYPRTLVGRRVSFPIPIELCLGDERRIGKELNPVAVRDLEDPRAHNVWAKTVVDSVCSLSLLSREGIAAPTFEPELVRTFLRSLDTKATSRYQTVPYQVVLYGIRHAVEFVLHSGDAIVDSFLNVIEASSNAGLQTASFAEKHGIANLLSSECIALGVRRWTIEPVAATIRSSGKSDDPQGWYRSLRANEGLWECVRVLYGAVQVIVGAMTARRITELASLNAGGCLAEGPTLIFRNGKPGTADYREVLRRPIPELVARVVRLLQRLQDGLIDLGLLASHRELFSYPLQLAGFDLSQASKKALCGSLDYFCDWAQMPCDADGCRYYLRQHQLRRFFAMVFFYGTGYGGLETLRWFLGHTDARHVWRYISESVPGAVLASVATEWAAYQVKHATREAEALAAELLDYFGTSDFAALDESSLTDHLTDLMVEGRLSIEPQFLDEGRSYRIAVVLRDKEAV